MNGYRSGLKNWQEPSDEFSFPPSRIEDVLRAIFGVDVDESDLVWLSGLLDCLLRFEDGSLVETFLGRVPNRTDYALACRQLLRVLYAVDAVMIRSGTPCREWLQVALALGLPSARSLTEAQIGRQFGVCKMAISKQVTKFLQLAELNPHGRGYNGMNLSRF